MSKSRQLKLSVLSAESLYYYTYNQVYKSRIDLINFYNVQPPHLKVKLLNRISNENCKVIDYLQVLSTTNTSREYAEFIWPAINMVQNFFSELNQDIALYNQLKDLKKDFSEDKETTQFLDTLNEDFELKHGINQNANVQAAIQNCLVKIEELSQQFGASLTTSQSPVLVPKELYEVLPKELQHFIDSSLKQNKDSESTQEFVKPVLNYSQVTSLFNHSPTIDLARKIFKLCLNYNRSQVFIIHALIKERATYAALLGFENYLHYQMSSLTAWKHSHVPFKVNLTKLNSFMDKIRGKYSQEATQTMYFLQKHLPQGTSTMHLSDIFYLRNKMLHTKFQLSGVRFLVSNILEFLGKITSSLFKLKLSFEECEGMHNKDKIILVQVKNEENLCIGYIYLDLFSRKDKAEINQQFFIQSGTDVSFSDNFSRQQKPIYYINCSVWRVQDENNTEKPEGPLDFELNFPAYKVLIHEFGHSVNNILNSRKYQLVSSTLLIDYAETMASLFEKICLHPSTFEYYFSMNKEQASPELSSTLQEMAAMQEVFRPWNLLEQIFYAEIDLRFHSISRKQLKDFTPKQLNTIYADTLKKVYGDIENLDLESYQDLSWFTNIEHLGSYGGLYFAYLLADYYSEKKIRTSFIEDIFDPEQGKSSNDKELINYLFRNAHSEDIFGKLWGE